MFFSKDTLMNYLHQYAKEKIKTAGRQSEMQIFVDKLNSRGSQTHSSRLNVSTN